MAANKAHREQRLAVIARLYSCGQTQAEIAAQLEITQQQVSYDLDILLKRWRKSSEVDTAQHLAREIEGINQLERQFQDAWTLSQRERESKRTRSGSSGDTRNLLAETRTEKRDGNPKFLEGVLRCKRLRCRLLGLLVAEKRDRSGDDIPRPKFFRLRVIDGQPANSDAADAV